MRFKWYNTELCLFTNIFLAFAIFRLQKDSGFLSLEQFNKEVDSVHQAGLF